MPEHSLVGRLRRALGRTGRAIRLALARRDGQAALVGTTVGYLIVYLWAIGHLAPGLGGFSMAVVSEPIATLGQSTYGTAAFAPIARVSLGPITYLASLNTVIGLGIAVLVGVNVALTTLAIRRPQACGLGGPTAGVFAGVPALLSGTACCGPVVLIALGMQASGVVLTAFEWLLPVAVVLLLVSLVLVGRQIRPAID